MPKNAVQRLQEIEKDIKTVISIFEISTQIKHGKIETPEKHLTQLPEDSAPECSKASLSIDKLREVPHHSQKGLCESPKKNRNIPPRPPQANHSGESLVTIHMKPNSPPSSRSMITMRESDMWQKQTDNPKEKRNLPASKTFYKHKHPDLFDSNEPVCNMVMTPSKTLQTASEILHKNNFDDSQKNRPLSQQSAVKQEKAENEKDPEKEKTNPRRSDPEQSKQSLRSGILKPKVEDNSRGTRLLLVRKKTQPGQVAKTSGDHMVMDTSPAFYIEPRKTKVIEKLTNENITTPKNKANTTIEEYLTDDSPNEKIRPKYQDNDKKVVFSYTASTPFNQKMPKSEESEEMELWTTELYKKIERSNEKLEKMKVFKELALDIAKHLKNKYDDIQKSKEELMEKLQKLEKHNERLNMEVKEANETKKKLQQKIEGFMATKTDDDPKPQGDGKEENHFKSKITKSQKQLSAEIYEKQQIIEKIQRERFHESRNDLITREILTDELQRLTQEKTDLLLKLNQTRGLIQERDTQIEKLNSQVQELEKEVKNQSQNLKTKTDAFQQTSEELHVLRKNFEDVESEVSEFKKKIENLESIHGDLIYKISEYEGQLKSNQKEINELKAANEKLETQLETEKDGLRIKNKIIDDQQETIRQLKEKADDAKNILKRNESLERILNIEREEKLELQEAVERLKRRKDELKTKLKNLENGLQFAPQEVLEDLKKTQAVLHELESQVQLKQNEWTMEQQLLLQAKEQACNVAEFATKKLMETTSELQRQSQAYKCLQRMVAEDLAMRKKQMRAEHKKERYQQLQGSLEPDITFPKKSES